MCRLSAYKGKALLIGDLVSNPDNSLILQSRDAAYHPGVVDKTHLRNILVNGDGFGVAWYGANTMKGSCCFKFLTPAWSNSNLRSIGEHIASPLIFAHVRAASSGHDMHERVVVSIENCHPFKFEQWTFMHNGGIPQFGSIKLALLNLLDQRFFREIKGSTDTEHIFALMLTFLYQDKEKGKLVKFSVDELVAAVNLTISTILSLCNEAQIEEACSLNLTVTDGVNIVATRFRNGPQHPPSLYYNFGVDFVCDADGHFYSSADSTKPADSIVISSAPLSKVHSVPASVEGCGGITDGCVHSKEDIGHWVLMPKDHMLIVHGNELQPEKVEGINVVPVKVSYPDLAALRNKNKSVPSPTERTNPTSLGLSLPPAPAKIIRFRSRL